MMTHGKAFNAIESVFSSMANNNARNFSVTRESLDYLNAVYGFKSCFDKERLVLGVKSGGYWPNNVKRGLTNRQQSSIFLIDADTGQLKALVGGNYLTAIKTATCSAVPIFYLARQDSNVIGIVGAGHQSTFQLEAALEQRNFKKIVAWNKDESKLFTLKIVADKHKLAFEVMDREQLCFQADVIITITSAHELLLMRDWIQKVTHIACMVTDTKGKQEIDPLLANSSSLFTDEIM